MFLVYFNNFSHFSFKLFKTNNKVYRFLLYFEEEMVIQHVSSFNTHFHELIYFINGNLMVFCFKKQISNHFLNLQLSLNKCPWFMFISWIYINFHWFFLNNPYFFQAYTHTLYIFSTHTFSSDTVFFFRSSIFFIYLYLSVVKSIPWKLHKMLRSCTSSAMRRNLRKERSESLSFCKSPKATSNTRPFK